MEVGFMPTLHKKGLIILIIDTNTDHSLRSTLSLFDLEGQHTPVQNHIPYPSFEPQERKMYSLAGVWKKKRFKADHDWTMQERTVGWINETENHSGEVTQVYFNDAQWEEKQVPAPENQLTGKEEVNAAETYENGVWYRKTFAWVEEDRSRVHTLKCLGVSYVGDFWLNGEYVGYHEGGYTPFAFDVTPFIKAGVNTLVIRIDNPPWTTRKDTVPAVNNDFFNYTGIIQDIFIESVHSVQVVRADLVPLNIEGNVQLRYVLENRTDQAREVVVKPSLYHTNYQSDNWLTSPLARSICKERAEMEGLENKTIYMAPGESKVISETFSIKNPRVWSIREPHLYVLGLCLVQNSEEIDAFYTQFGIRTVATKGTQILLNDTPIFLAGVARHEEWPEYGRTAAWDRIVADLQVISDLHVNMVRTAHYPNHIHTFIALDRIGLTSMSEIPLWQFEKEHFEIQERRRISYQMWREMIFSNYNRPSIIMWSTQNESKEVMLRKAYNEALVKEVKEMYADNRLITQSAAADQPGFHDESMEPLDVAGWTMYFGIFHGSTPYEGTKAFIEKAHKAWPSKPIINTEYGLWSNADKSFIEKQVNVYEDVQLALIEKATVTPEGEVNNKGYVAAIDYWTAFDWYVNHNEFYQTMGMLHMDRETKKPLFNRFVEDHKRLIHLSNGMGTLEMKAPEVVDFSYVKQGRLHQYSFTDYRDFRPFNYLIVLLNNWQGIGNVEIGIRSNEHATIYLTYELEEKLVIPLWKLNQDVLARANQLFFYLDDNQEVDVHLLYVSKTGF